MGDIALAAAWGIVDLVTSTWTIAAGIAAIPLTLATAWLIDHRPVRNRKAAP